MAEWLKSLEKKMIVAGASTLGSGILTATADGAVSVSELVVLGGATVAAVLLAVSGRYVEPGDSQQ